MNIDDLKKLVKNGESEILEFKSSTGQLDSGARDLCGILNRDGGYLLFGVKDDGSIVGQEVSDKTKKSISQKRIQYTVCRNSLLICFF